MSELTPCNHCTLKRIREKAKEEGKKVTRTFNHNYGGFDVFVDGEKRIWMQEITQSCCC